MGEKENGKAAPQGGDLKDLALVDVIPTPDNPRTIRKGCPIIKELAESIKQFGVLEPVLCRPHPTEKGKYDLRAGARRFSAAGVAGLSTIPARVFEWDDHQALEVTITENLQREDLHPLEEGKGVAALIADGWRLEDVAAHLGKSAMWVSRRAQLTKLHKKWADEALKGEECRIPHWGAAHFERLAALPDAVQASLADEMINDWEANGWTVKELEGYILRDTRELSRAPWSLDDATLLPKVGACAACPKRTDCQPELFDGWEEEDAGKKKAKPGVRCLDQACWQAKASAWRDRMVTKATEDHGGKVVKVSDSYYTSEKGVVPIGNLERCKKDAKGAQACVIVAGNDEDKIGTVFYAKPRTEKSSRNARPKDPKTGKPKPRPLAARRKDLEKRRHAFIIQKLEKDVAKVETGTMVELHGDAWPDLVCTLAVIFGTKERHETHFADKRLWNAYDATVKSWDLVAHEAWLQVRPVLAGRLKFHTQDHLPEIDARRIAELIGLKWADLEVAAAAEIPEPKSWANLNADGTPKGANKPKAAKATAKPKAKAKSATKTKRKTTKKKAKA